MIDLSGGLRVYFEQFYLGCLSHASYMLGSEGIAAVVDPRRDVGIYLEEAAKQGLDIRYVIETHLHADFVSGHNELAALTGASIYLGAQAKARFPHVAVHDGQGVSFGRCRLKFLETPGHSLDSISVLVTDLDRSEEPFAVLTGDTLFIGDVGRPDLAKGRSAEEMAALLYRSLSQKLLQLPDSVEVYPAHGAGSLCGRQMGAERSSTIGRERALNYALRPTSEADFVRLVTNDLPERPEYFAQDKERNRDGVPIVANLPEPRPLKPAEVISAQQTGAVVLDTRPSSDFARAHLPGSLHIGLSGQFASWAGDLLGLGASVVLVAENFERVKEARIRLARVGIDSVLGYVEDGIAGWIREGMPLKGMPVISVEDLHHRLSSQPGSLQVVDVRRTDEWELGHVDGARLIPLHDIPAKSDQIGGPAPVAVYCQGGYRSAIAGSLLLRAGHAQVLDVAGGFDAWRACGLPFAPGNVAAAQVRQ